MSITQKISFGVIAFLSIGIVWLLLQNSGLKDDIHLLESNIQTLKTSNESLVLEVSRGETGRIAISNQLLECMSSTSKYVEQRERNNKILNDSTCVEVDKTKMVDDETVSNIINVLNSDFSNSMQ